MENRTEHFYGVPECHIRARGQLVKKNETYMMQAFKNKCLSLFWIAMYPSVFLLIGC